MKWIWVWLLCGAGWSWAGDIVWEPYEAKTRSGHDLKGELGYIEVPENRQRTESRTIKLYFVRYKSTNPNPGAPIVYLAGGPGGSGIRTALGGRAPLFQALRAVADVIAFDQRGTGKSNAIPKCTYIPEVDISQGITLAQTHPYRLDEAQKCRAFWREQGVDLDGYTTLESAHDLADLRKALGVKKLNLWGISYGTHLAFAAMKVMPDGIERAVLASSEGLNHTIKLPAYSDMFLKRVEQVIQADPSARERYPALMDSMRKVLEKLDQEPVKAPLGSDGFVLLGRREIQVFTAFTLVKNPENISRLPAAFAAMAQGDFSAPTQLFQYYWGSRGNLGGMGQAMDSASGITADRLTLFQFQAKSALLGDMLNFPFPQMFGAYGVPDLGDDFRQEVQTDIPTLFLNGTLDGRTFPEETWQIMRGFSRGMQIIVEHAGHDLFMVDPRVGQAVTRFFKDGSVVNTLISVPPPSFQ